MIAANGGVPIAWESSGSGAPVLLIHGLGYGRWGWAPLVPLLATRYQVVTFDNRGIGASAVAPGPYTAATMAGDALAVLDAAGIARAHVVGTSLGGMIAQELAITAPHRVDRLVLIASTPGATGGFPMPEVTVQLLAEAAAMPLEAATRRLVENALGKVQDPAIVNRIVSARRAAAQDPAGWAAQAAAGLNYDGAGRFGSISAPTLVLTGTADVVVDPRNSAVLADLIPNSTLHLIPDGGHLLFWELPRVVADLIMGHLG